MFKNIEPVNGKSKNKPKYQDKENIIPNQSVGKSAKNGKKKVKNTTPDILSTVLAPNYKNVKRAKKS